MNTPPPIGRPCIEWDVVSRVSPGEAISGDLHLVMLFPGGALAAVVDGLGHGDEAATAARTAIDTLATHAGKPVIPLVQRCHEALKITRGAVMTVVSFNFNESTVTALGIGNVETVLLRANRAATPSRELVLLRGGIVGDQLPALHASHFFVEPGDVLIFATDGIREGFWEQVNVDESMRQLVNRILKQNLRGADDALVLAVRYLGKPNAD